MIKPHKFMNIELSILNISSYIVNCLKTVRYETYDQLLKNVSNYFEDDIKDLFILALTFLFAVGVIDYNKEKDQVEMLL